MRPRDFRLKLLEWYKAAHRDLPWRRTRDPYAIWVSEIMLQQTRVAAALPYYHRFLQRFPTVESLASAPEEDLLLAWSGLGYYTRVRNLQRAARTIGTRFPNTYHGIAALPGVGEYTAAAIASIAFDLPYAAVDGNVLRVISRIADDDGDIASSAVRRRFSELAQTLVDPDEPGDFNQAMMELGATVCLPRDPQCLVCPVSELCSARRTGRQNALPVKGKRPGTIREKRTVYIICRRDEMLLWQRPAASQKLAGFWELPEPEHLHRRPSATRAGEFPHAIVNHQYTFEVLVAAPSEAELFEGCKNVVNTEWIACNRLEDMALSTTARKAIHLFRRSV